MRAEEVAQQAIAFGCPPLPAEPADVLALLTRWSAPPRLVAHLHLVHAVAVKLVGLAGDVDEREVLFGAAIHDIGKAFHPEELVGPGKRHEESGKARLIEAGVPQGLRPFRANTWLRDRGWGDWPRGSLGHRRGHASADWSTASRPGSRRSDSSRRGSLRALHLDDGRF